MTILEHNQCRYLLITIQASPLDSAIVFHHKKAPSEEEAIRLGLI